VVTPVAAARPDAGLFGPGSMAWRIDGEVLTLAGGTAALLMQLAHPAVAAGVAQHSDFQADPFARLRRTLNASYAIVFGTTAQADAAIRRMNAIHGVVRGQVPETGEPYRATDPTLLLWVHASLIDTALRVYDGYVARLTADEQQAYHAESRQIAVRLGVPPDAVPATLVELRAEMLRLLAGGTVAVSDTARTLAPAVLHPTRFPPPIAWDVAHLISISVMPEPIRRGFGLSWSAQRARGMERLASLSRRAVPLMPRRLRRVPQALAAEQRLGLRR
jgi:uncharacterized protein (DUF2236 family)